MDKNRMKFEYVYLSSFFWSFEVKINMFFSFFESLFQLSASLPEIIHDPPYNFKLTKFKMLAFECLTQNLFLPVKAMELTNLKYLAVNL